MKGKRTKKSLLISLFGLLIINVLIAGGMVSAELVADFSVQDECGLKGTEYPAYDYLLLNDTTTSPDGEQVVSWTWEDSISGNFSSDPNPEKYRLPSQTTAIVVNLTVTGDEGSSRSVSKTLFALDDSNIDANFSYIVEHEGDTPLVRFIDQSQTSGQNIIGWYWNIDGVEYSNVQMPEVYLPSGEYNAILVVVTDQNQMARIEKTIVVYTTKETTDPTADFEYIYEESEELNTTVAFFDKSTGYPTSWFWDFGDEYVSFERNPVHTYSLFGTYTVSLLVSNSMGTDIFTNPDVDLPVPSEEPIYAGFTVTKSGPRTYKFENDSSGPVLLYSLDYGDGSKDPSGIWPKYHTFKRAGNYLVTLTALNDVNKEPLEGEEIFTKRIYVL